MSAIPNWLSSNPDLRVAIAISLGAIPGALSRYYLTGWLTQWLGLGFPYGTFFINTTGSFAMGLFITFILAKAPLLSEIRLLVAVGFLGSYTTFSTYALDSSALMKSQNYPAALFYWVGSAILGVVGFEMGSFIARRFL